MLSQQLFFRPRYKKVAADPNGLKVMHDKDAKWVVNFKDIPDQEIRPITATALIINGDKDVTTLEHAFELHRLIPILSWQ